MGRFNRKQLAAKNQMRGVGGTFGSKKVDNDPVTEAVEDWEAWQEDIAVAVENIDLMEEDDITSLTRTINSVLIDNTKKRDRAAYTGNSRATKYRRIAEAKKVNPKQTLFNFGITVIEKPKANEEQLFKKISSKKQELMLIESAYEDIVKLTAPVMNKSKKGSTADTYDFVRYTSVKMYFRYRLAGYNKGESSEKVAQDFWPNSSKAYRAKSIVKWSKEFLRQGELSRHCQGVHIKRESLLNDADVKGKILEMIRATKPAERSLSYIKKYIEDDVFPLILGVTGSISEPTLSKYLYEWGYSYRKNQKAIYFDGHEREDVVKYRNEWCQRMLGYMRRSEFYEGDEEEVVIEPVLKEGERKVVFVTHDESTFYANDGKNDLWLQQGENYLRKKGVGLSIMVSEFQCPCHGTMRYGDKSSRHLFKAGTNREGWWTYKDMVNQLKEDAIYVFEKLHPGCVGVFLFDNSSNHGAFADDALVASRMTLNRCVWNNKPYNFRDSPGVLPNGEDQKFFEVVKETHHTLKGKFRQREVKYFKGIKAILEERNRWLCDLNGDPWKLHCGSPEPGIRAMCCARHFLENNCADFKDQKSALEEVVINSGHIFELYPKYHCECNWIEMYWGGAKREARLKCDYTFASLEKNIDNFLDTAANIKKIRRYFQRCMNYIDAYSECQDGREVAENIKKFVTKKYLSHRKVKFTEEAN